MASWTSDRTDRPTDTRTDRVGLDGVRALSMTTLAWLMPRPVPTRKMPPQRVCPPDWQPLPHPTSSRPARPAAVSSSTLRSPVVSQPESLPHRSNAVPRRGQSSRIGPARTGMSIGSFARWLPGGPTGSGSIGTRLESMPLTPRKEHVGTARIRSRHELAPVPRSPPARRRDSRRSRTSQARAARRTEDTASDVLSALGHGPPDRHPRLQPERTAERRVDGKTLPQARGCQCRPRAGSPV